MDNSKLKIKEAIFREEFDKLTEDMKEDMGGSNLLEEIDKYCIDNSIPNVDEQVGKLFSILVKTSGAKNILEIGTGVGYSTIWLALAARENKGKVLTIERNSNHASIAREYFKKANLKNINLLNGEALVLLQNIDEKFDFVFIDATKDEYIYYIKLISTKLVKPALIVADNAISHAIEVSDYLDYVRTDENISSVLIPIRAGLELSYFN